MRLRVWFLILALPILVFAQDTKENADFKLAVNLYNDKMYDLALEQFRQFISSYPNTQQGIEARFYLGLSQAKLNKHEDARLTFQNFALAFPDHPKAPDAWWNVAEAYVALKNPHEAALAFERVKTFHPKSKLAPSALAKASEYFDASGDHENAKKILRTLIQDYSSADVALPARLRLAEIYFSENQFELARAESKRVADLSKEFAQKSHASVMVAEALTKLGKYDEAQNSLNDVIKNYRSTPSYYSALLLIGSLQRDVGDFDDAVASWKAVADDSAKAPAAIRQNALLQMGDSYGLREDYPKALIYFEKALPLKGARGTEALLRAGHAAEKINNTAKAFGYFKRALGDSLTQDARKNALLGAIHSATGAKNFNEAIRFSLMFRDQFPNDTHVASVLFDAAKVYQDQLKDYRQAISLYEHILRDVPTSPLVDDALFNEAEALRQSGSLEQAVQLYESLEKRFPSSELIERAHDAVEAVRLFELKNKDAGLEKLALLIGDVIAQESKGDLAFRLAEIYYHELKDYERAAAQYAQAIQLRITSVKRPTALYYQAKSYENLSLKRRLAIGAETGNLASQAIAIYDSLLSRFPLSEFFDDGVIAQFKLKLQTASNIADLRKIEEDFQRRYSTAKRKDVALMALGKAYQGLKSYEDAATTFSAFLKQYPASDLVPDVMMQLSQALVAMGEKDTAVIVLQNYYSKFPSHGSSARAAWELAHYYGERGNAAQAIALYQAIEQSYFYTVFNKNLDVLRGDTYFQAGDVANAIKNYQEYISSAQKESGNDSEIPREVIFNLASSYEKAGNKSEAKKYYAAYLVRDPLSERAGRAYYALAKLASSENNLTLASKYFQQASRFSLGSADQLNPAVLESAELYFRSEDYTNAITRYNEAAQQSKGDSLQQHLQARIIVSYFRLNNTKEADSRAAAFIKSFPNQPRYAAEFEYERGMYFLRRNDLANAKKYFDNVIQEYSETSSAPPALYGNARIAELGNKPQEAIQLYQAVLQKYPNDEVAPRVQLSLGNAYYAQEQWDPAARQFKAVLDNEARAPELAQFAMNNLILAYKELNLNDAALELTRKYIERFPDDPELINKRIEIGVLYQKLGYYDQAVLHLQGLLENANADLEAEIRYYIGEALFYKGDYQQAILEFLKVPYLVTKRTKVDWIATSYYMAGQSYEKMSKFDQAIAMYKQIIERPGIDATFKSGAQKEIDRVNALVKNSK